MSGPVPADHRDSGADLVFGRVVTRPEAAFQPLQVIAGPVQLLGAGGESGIGAGRGMHEYPAQCQDRVALARAGQAHGVFGHMPPSAPVGGFALVTLGGVVDPGRLFHGEPGQPRSRDVGLGRRGHEGHPVAVHCGQVRIRDQLGVPDDQQPALRRHALQGLHHGYDLADLAGTAVEGPVKHRDTAVPADRDPGLNLLQIQAAVLGMAELRSGEPVLVLRVLAVHRDRGHIPVHPGHIDPERPDRRHPDRPGDLV